MTVDIVKFNPEKRCWFSVRTIGADNFFHKLGGDIGKKSMLVIQGRILLHDF